MWRRRARGATSGRRGAWSGTGRRARGPETEPVQASAGVVSNGRITLRFKEAGRVELEQDGRVLRSLLSWESRRDRGDLYTPAIREDKLSARLLNTRLVHRGPWRASVE